jgi:hypothetical protein
LPVGRSGRFKLEREQLRIKGNVISCYKKRFAVSDDISEDLSVASDATNTPRLEVRQKD